MIHFFNRLFFCISLSLAVLGSSAFSPEAQADECDCESQLIDAPQGVAALLEDVGDDYLSKIADEDKSPQELGFERCPGASFKVSAPGTCKPGSVIATRQGFFKDTLRVRPVRDGIYLLTKNRSYSPASASAAYKPAIHIARILDDRYLTADLKRAVENQLGVSLTGDFTGPYSPNLNESAGLSGTDRLGIINSQPECMQSGIYPPEGMRWQNHVIQLSVFLHNPANSASVDAGEPRVSYIEYKVELVNEGLAECIAEATRIRETSDRGSNLVID